MSIRSTSLTALLVLCLFGASAHAHDPALHALPAQKAKPTTCEQLADTERYSADLADKALKAKCETESKQKPLDKETKADQGDE